jgi:hypothetical protein
MKKILFLTLLLVSILNARENPFSPLHLLPVQKIKTKIAEPIITKPAKVIVQKPIMQPASIIKKLPIAKTIPIVKIKKAPVVAKKKKSPCSKKRVVKKHKKRVKTKLLYANKFTKIKLHSKTITIKTNDTLLKEFTLKHPNRIVFDFERFDSVKTFSKKVYSRYVKNIKLGHHDYFYRVIFTLAKNRRYKLIKKPYGYAISIL